MNLHDPEVITIAGLAPNLRAAAPDAFADSFHHGLMDGPLLGALSLGIDEITNPAALANWESLTTAG